jgi:hypothetical protein
VSSEGAKERGGPTDFMPCGDLLDPAPLAAATCGLPVIAPSHRPMAGIEDVSRIDHGVETSLVQIWAVDRSGSAHMVSALSRRNAGAGFHA